METMPIPEVTTTLTSAHGVVIAAIPHALSHLPMPKALSVATRLLCGAHCTKFPHVPSIQMANV